VNYPQASFLKSTLNCWAIPSARCRPLNVVIGNSTLIRLNKLAMGESFSLSPHVRRDEALVGGWSAVRPTLCYDLCAREETDAVLAILVKVAES
jgi:hypothetical protein